LSGRKAEILKTLRPNLLEKPFREEVINAVKEKKESLEASKEKNTTLTTYRPRLGEISRTAAYHRKVLMNQFKIVVVVYAFLLHIVLLILDTN